MLSWWLSERAESSARFEENFNYVSAIGLVLSLWEVLHERAPIFMIFDH